MSKKSQNRCTLLNTFRRKGKDSETDPDPQHCWAALDLVWKKLAGGTCSGELAGLAAAVGGGVEASPDTLERTHDIREAV